MTHPGDPGSGPDNHPEQEQPPAEQPGPSYGEQPPAYGQEPPAYGQQPSYGIPHPPQYGQPYAQPYGYGPPVYAPQPPQHPKATTALILGIVGLVGGMTCYLPVLLSPFAWAVGRRAVREIDASHGHLSGRGSAQAGAVLGIIGTILLGLMLVGLVVLLVALGMSSPDPRPLPADV